MGSKTNKKVLKSICDNCIRNEKTCRFKYNGTYIITWANGKEHCGMRISNEMEKLMGRVITLTQNPNKEVCAVSDCNEIATHYVSFMNGMGVFTCKKHKRDV